MIDLNKCSPGDYLIARNGSLFVYEERRNINYLRSYPHIISNSKHRWSTLDDGQVYRECKSDYDIVEIVPQTNSSTPYFELYEKLRLYKRASAVA